MIRMAGILLDIADGTHREFDELIMEQRGTTYWIHFAVRPKDNRRKILFDPSTKSGTHGSKKKRALRLAFPLCEREGKMLSA